MEWVVLIIGLALAAAAVVAVIYLLPKRPASSQGAQQSTTDPAALQREQLDRARERRVELERRVAMEETLRFEEDERDFLHEELDAIRQARRQRRQSLSTKKP